MHLYFGGSSIAPASMKRAALLAAIFACAVDARADNPEFRCFTSDAANPPIQLQFDPPVGRARIGHITYRNGSGSIPVKLVKTASEETAPGRPDNITTTWRETTPGGGTYTMVSQGARFYGFTYVRARDKKTFEFSEDLAAMGDDRCTWAHD